MEGLEFYQLVFYFVIYGFVGWLMEVIYYSHKAKRFTAKGFLASPVLPIYGFGSLMVIGLMYVTGGNIFLFLILSIIATSALEYMTSFLLEKIFHRSWWNYKNEPLNLNGRICLRNSVLWGVISIFFIKIVHPHLVSIATAIPPYIGTVVALFIIAILLIDTTWGIIAIFEENKLEEKLRILAMSIEEKEKKIGGLIGNKQKEIRGDITSLRKEYENMVRKYIPAFLRKKLKDIPPINDERVK